jgi:diguanylate cyclase (GGDEF)-like protein
MQTRFDLNLKWLGAIVVAIVLCLAGVPWLSGSEADHTMATLKHVADRERGYNRLLALLKDAETGQRGYIITGDKDFLDSYYSARSELQGVLDGLAAGAASPAEQSLTRELTALSDKKMAELAETIHLRETSGFAAAAAVVADRRGKSYMDSLRRLLGERLASMSAQREALRDQLGRRLDHNTLIAMVASGVSIVIICAALFIGGRSLRQRGEAADQARRLGEAQAAHAYTTQVRNERLTLTAQMLQALDSLTVTADLSGVLPAFLPRLLPGTGGAVYLYRNSRDHLERCANWGTGTAWPELIAPGQCWGLRLGAPHRTDGGDALHCAHCAAEAIGAAGQRLCVPMMSQGEVVGLAVVAAPAAVDTLIEQAFVVTLAEQLALGISNINLREVLRRQSTVDELTGLYNRRYFDEACRHELFRAERKHTPFALVMIDLDHFKRINDTYGHDAGDLVLREAARRIQDTVRRSDIACRYGGEELVVLLPECDAGAAAKCAETIRHAIAGMSLRHHDLALPPVTASLGVAA